MMLELLQRIERIERQMHNIALLGTVADANYSTGRLKIAIGDLVTGWLPWMTQRAGGDVTWDAPEIGEQVAVISPSGELGNGFVIPAIYQDAHPANGSTPDLDIRTYKDGAAISYDRAAHHLSATLPAGATTVLVSDGGISITGDISVTGKITSTGDMIAAGISLDNHVHGGILPGGANTGVPQ